MNFWRAFKTLQSYLTLWVIIAGESPAKKYCFLYYFSIEFPSVSLMRLYYIKLSSQQHHQIRMRTRRSLFCNAHWYFHMLHIDSQLVLFFDFNLFKQLREKERRKKNWKDNFLISLNVSYIKESSWKINE